MSTQPITSGEVDPEPGDLLQIHLDVRSSSVSAVELASILGVIPDESINRGTPRQFAAIDATDHFRLHNESLWSITSGSLSLESVDAHLDRLWPRAEVALTRIHEVPGDVGVILSFHHRIDGRAYQGHGLWLPSEWVKLLGKADAAVDIDQYVSGTGFEE